MSATVDPEPQQATADLAEELHDLEAQEAALERRTKSLELAGPLAFVFAFFALALAAGAFLVALNKDGNNGVSMMNRVTPAAASNGTMMGSSGMSMMKGVGGHGSFTSGQVAAAAHGKVYVQLGEFWAAPAVSSVQAGKVTFVAENVGQLPHELMIERMPIKMDGPNAPNEDAAQGMIDDMSPGKSGHMTLQLKPGTYMLFCNIEGHYAAGQHTVFTVKS